MASKPKLYWHYDNLKLSSGGDGATIGTCHPDGLDSAWMTYCLVTGKSFHAPTKAECRRLLEESIRETLREIVRGMGHEVL